MCYHVLLCVLLCFTNCCNAVCDATRYYVLLHVTTHYYVLLCVTMWYHVLLRVTVCYYSFVLLHITTPSPGAALPWPSSGSQVTLLELPAAEVSASPVADRTLQMQARSARR